MLPGSRMWRQIQAIINLKLQRVGGAWRMVGDPLLLRLERQLHQRSRFLGRQPLRLQAPHWSADALFQDLPPCWIGNPFSTEGSTHHCLDLLEQWVIDAGLATLRNGRPAMTPVLPAWTCSAPSSIWSRILRHR